MGEHSVVYGRPAIVATLGLLARARVARYPGRGVRLDLPDLDWTDELAWRDLGSFAADVRARWREFAEGREPFRGLGRDDPGALVKLALGELACELGDTPLPGIELRVVSEIPVGAGFGSSAAVAVAVLAATLALLTGEASLARLERLTLEVERRQHGTPSGADHRTVLAGGIHRYDPGLEAGLTALAAGGALDRLAIFHTGEPAQATGEVVAAVRRARDRDPVGFEARLERMGAAVEAFEDELTRPTEDGVRTTELIVCFEQELEAIGVVPEAVCGRIRDLEDRGAAAKVSGAGSLTGPGAGGLLVYTPFDAGDLSPALDGLTRLSAPLGVEGVRIEEAA